MNKTTSLLTYLQTTKETQVGQVGISPEQATLDIAKTNPNLAYKLYTAK